MVRLTTLALIVILIFIQLSSIECKKNGKKKNKGCKFNGDTLTAEAKITYDDMCVELVCRKLKRKGKEQKKGGGGKRKNKFKYVFVAEAIKYCYPNKCKDIECDGPCMPPCATVNGRCMPPALNITDGGNNGTMKCIPCNKRIWDPVCGDDGNTYSNACMLDFANCENGNDVKQVSRGKCEGGEKRKVHMEMPKRDIHRKKETQIELFGKKKNNGKKRKCRYNGRKVGINKVKDLGIHCTQLKCTKDTETGSPKLEIQYNPDCKC